jgi:hypothetical protein
VASYHRTRFRARHRSAFELFSRRICAGLIEWELAFELGTVERSGLGLLQKSEPFHCQVVGLVWLGEAQGDADAAVEIARVVAVKHDR